jgi:hypothetical protein
MISRLLLLLFPFDCTAEVAVHAAYAIHTQAIAPQECCGMCKNGVITHGDGHTTPCPCPPTCKCRVKATLPCKDGSCKLQPKK